MARTAYPPVFVSEPKGVLMFLPVDDEALQERSSEAALILRELEEPRGGVVYAVAPRLDAIEARLESSCSEPPSASELSDWEQNYYSLDSNLAAKVGFTLGSASSSARRRVLISEFSRSAPCAADDGTELHYGIAVRLVVLASNFEAGANLTLPWVAAQAQFNRVETESKLTVTGYVGDLGPFLPPIRAFTVDTYVDLMQKVSAIQAHVASDTANIRPKKLRIVDPSLQEQEQKWAIGAVWALTRIADGDSCMDARHDFPEQTETASLGAIEDVYRQFGSQGCDEANPSEEAKETAKDLLHDLRLRD